MGMTMTQKILASHCKRSSVSPGELIHADLDLVMGSDVTTPIALQELERSGLDTIWDNERIVLVMDHFAPNKDIPAARNCKKVRDFASRHQISHFYDGGKMGIEHALLPEQGLVAPSELIIGADSHTCTYGALGAFSTGIGSTDMAAGMVTGQGWFKIPEAIRVTLKGCLAFPCSGKDVILTLIGMIGVDGARYKSIEFQGDGIRSLNMDDRFAICNMVIEAGAKNGIFPVDEQTLDYLDGRVQRPFTITTPDPDAVYAQEIEIDLSRLAPVAAGPSLPSNVKPVTEYYGIRIQQAVIGSCSNGRISDLQTAAGVMDGKKVHPSVRCIIIPATPSIYRQAMSEGLLDIFLESGALISMPTCGPCNGGHVGVLAEGERCVSTTNRNFVGRMGAISSEVYLASPAVAAASAIAGKLTVPD